MLGASGKCRPILTHEQGGGTPHPPSGYFSGGGLSLTPQCRLTPDTFTGSRPGRGPASHPYQSGPAASPDSSFHRSDHVSFVKNRVSFREKSRNFWNVTPESPSGIPCLFGPVWTADLTLDLPGGSENKRNPCFCLWAHRQIRDISR